MHAAVVRSFDQPPHYEEFETPHPAGDQVLVDMLAAGLHPRVRSGANGTHYTSDGRLPMVPGVDGVGRLPDGRCVYFVADAGVPGTMAQRAIVDPGRAVPLPEHTDPVVIAAAMNPAMSSWVALRQRIAFGGRQQVLILGATGNAGRLAIQVAKRFGASRVIAAGRDSAKLAELPALGADEVCTFGQLARAADVDVVIDYVWGEPTGAAMVDIVTNRADRGRPLTWIEIGAIAGPEAPIPAAALRAARLQIVGSGIGSVAGRDFVEELPLLAEAVAEGAFDVRAQAVPLAEVERVWAGTAGTSDRIVLVP
jgi:NADPH:quinone reductase-like Zn-dependent oxidoreductase